MEINDLTIAELVELARSEEDSAPTRESTKKDNASVMNFIKKVGITCGEKRVLAAIIYYEYRILNNGKVGREAFFHTFAKYFDAIRSGGRRYYLINDVFETSREHTRVCLDYSRRGKREQKKQ